MWHRQALFTACSYVPCGLVLCRGIAEGFRNSLLVSWRGTSSRTVNVESDNFWVPSWRLPDPAIRNVFCCLSYSVSFVLRIAITDSSLQLCAPKAFMHSENGFSVPQRTNWTSSEIYWTSSQIGFKWLPQFHNYLSKAVICYVFTVNFIHSSYSFQALLPQVRESSDERMLNPLTAFTWKTRVLHFLLLQIQGAGHFILFALLHIINKSYIKAHLREGANRKQFHCEERWSAVQESTINLKLEGGSCSEGEPLPVSRDNDKVFIVLMPEMTQIENHNCHSDWIKEGDLTVESSMDGHACGILLSASPKLERGKTRMERTCKMERRQEELRFWYQIFAFWVTYLWEN